jgi:hypothetical protein
MNPNTRSRQVVTLSDGGVEISRHWRSRAAALVMSRTESLGGLAYVRTGNRIDHLFRHGAKITIPKHKPSK